MILNVVLLLFIIFHLSCKQVEKSKVDGSEIGKSVVAVWTDLETGNFPSMRAEYAMAYDINNEKIVAYGGRTGFRSDFQHVNETWAFDYNQNYWNKLDPKNSPPWRVNHTMVYDPVRQKILMFGGNDFIKLYNDLWEFDYSRKEWINITPDYSPEARQMHGMVYIPDRKVILMYGGRRIDGSAAFSDLWELNCELTTWRKLNPAENPGVLDHVNITYDLSVNKVLLYTSPDIWAYDFHTNAWTNLMPPQSPVIDHSSFIYDPFLKKSVLFGSSVGMDEMLTWVYNYTKNRWEDVTPVIMPGDYIEHDAMVYLPDKNVFIQYGGCCSDKTLELKLTEE